LRPRVIQAGADKPEAGLAGAGIPADTDRQRYLREVCGLLWPSPATVTVGRARHHGVAVSRATRERRRRAREREFILLLGRRRPRLLIPAAPAAGAAAVRSYGEPGSATARLGARALALALASGVGGTVLRSRVRVHAPQGSSTIESHLRGALQRDVRVSLYLGPARANRKPVVQILTPKGQPVGFAKIGSSALTRTLVHAERGALARLAEAGLSDVTVPQVLHYGEWRGMNVLVLSTLPVWLRRRQVTAARLTAAMISVAGVGGHRREPLAESPYWQRLTERLSAADAGADRDTLLGALDTLCEHAGDAPLTMGSWHGDWTPWNMASTRGGLLVWDWERFTGGVPLGFDALHYRLQKDVVPGHREPQAAAARCLEGAPATLAAFGVDAGEARVTGTLYLAELATRYLADRQAEAGALLGAPGTWLIPAITEQVKRL
jgi:Phosphotransferase enzyme family